MNEIDLAQVVNNLNRVLKITALEGIERTAAYEAKLSVIYKSPINAPLKKLKDLLGVDSKNRINIDESTGGSIYDNTLLMRKELAILLSKSQQDERKRIAKWIVETWGGIPAGKNDESLNECVSQADKVDENDGKVFNFDRVASWSKYLAFKKPDKYAIYDARVIYSLNWLLYQSGATQYLPFLSGRNSVMEMLDYQLYLFLGKDRAHVAKVKAALKEDIKRRREKSVELADSKLTNNSYFSSGLIKNGDLFVKKSDAFSVYCSLLQKLSMELFPLDAENQLTKTEMLLFAIADAEIAEAVLNYISDLSTTDERYTIDDLMIIDAAADPVPRVYIRELLDSGCREYQRSRLNAQQKLEVINALGLEALTRVLEKCFLNKGPTYDAKDAALFTWHLLNGTMGEYGRLKDEANEK